MLWLYSLETLFSCVNQSKAAFRWVWNQFRFGYVKGMCILSTECTILCQGNWGVTVYSYCVVSVLYQSLPCSPPCRPAQPPRWLQLSLPQPPMCSLRSAVTMRPSRPLRWCSPLSTSLAAWALETSSSLSASGQPWFVPSLWVPPHVMHRSVTGGGAGEGQGRGGGGAGEDLTHSTSVEWYCFNLKLD